MAAAAIPVLPYCGPPPDPAAIWTTWRLDPVVLTLLCVGWALYFFACRRGGLSTDAPDRARRCAFHAGWIIGSLALVSPLCPLSVSLFTAREAQHLVLTLIAAPLIASGRPLLALRAGFGIDAPRLALPSAPVAAAGTFAALFWTWHMPVPYAATFASVFIYWTMHVTLIGTAIWLWSCLLGGTRSGILAALLASVLSAIQMGLLGALVTLSPRPFYAPHFLTTATWGFSPLQDQQLGGVLMWTIGCSAFFVVAMIGFARSLSESDPVAGAPSVQRGARAGRRAAVAGS